jgi:hypothetical protein
MENNNNFIELLSNFKPTRVKIDLANMPINYYSLRTIFFFFITILMIETKYANRSLPGVTK